MMRFQVKVIILTMRNNYSLEKQTTEGLHSRGSSQRPSATTGGQSSPFQGLFPILECVHREIFFTSEVRESRMLARANGHVFSLATAKVCFRGRRLSCRSEASNTRGWWEAPGIQVGGSTVCSTEPKSQ